MYILIQCPKISVSLFETEFSFVNDIVLGFLTFHPSSQFSMPHNLWPPIAALSPKPLLWTTVTHNQVSTRMSHGHLKKNTVRPRSSLSPNRLLTVPPPHSRQVHSIRMNSGETQFGPKQPPCLSRTCQPGFFLPQGLCTCQSLCQTCWPQGTCSSCFLSPFSSSHKGMISKALFEHKGHTLPVTAGHSRLFCGFIFLFDSHCCQIMIYVFLSSSVSPAGLFYSLLFPHFPMPRTTTGI